MTQEELAALGIHPIPIPIPFLAAGGPVNVYALEEADDAGGGLLLVDAGYHSAEATAALAAGLARLGRGPGDVRRVVLTHGHVDHYGGARFLEERAGRPLPVFAHAADAGKVSEAGPRWRTLAPRYVAHLGRMGVPPPLLDDIVREGERGFHAQRVQEVAPLAPGARLRTRHLDLEVLHMPGHTPGMLCLYDRAHGLLFSGDHLLQYISPNPVMELGPRGEDRFFEPLRAYLQSLARTRALEVETVLPGHGPPFGDHRAVIDTLLGFYRRRQERFLSFMAEGPLTPFDLACRLFRQVRPGDAFLILSEVMGNLEVMEAEGVIEQEHGGDGVRRYRVRAWG